MRHSSLSLALLLVMTPIAFAQSGGAYKVGTPYVVDGRTYTPADDRTLEEEGTASWYGTGFHGRRTSNGEMFDENELTAAHRTLPMPSWVKVTNLNNGRALVVRVNDRGPFHSDRVIDVSTRAAELLGFKGRGSARVKLQRVAPPEDGQPQLITASLPGTNDDGPAASVPPAMPAPSITLHRIDDSRDAPQLARGINEETLARFFVQAASLSSLTRAQIVAADASQLGAASIEAKPDAGGERYQVRLGPYLRRETAEEIADQLRAVGYGDAKVLAPQTASRPAG